MKIHDAFPSKYLKASDIPPAQFVPVKIDRVEVEDVAGDSNPDNDKPVIYFIGKQKGMVLNRTNATAISSKFGDDTDNWHGKTVLLYSTETSFQGKNVPCIRIKIKSEVAAPAITRAVPRDVAPEAPEPVPAELNDDDIPF